MKKMVLFFLFTGVLLTQAKAQFLGGFFNQQARKEKLMAEQVAGLKICLHAIKSGYNIAETGLNKAHELKNGTFGLHTAYFSSLEQVSPVVQANPKAKCIYDLHQQIISVFNNEITWQQKAQLLSPEEYSYLQRVYNNLLAESQKDLNELVQVLTPGKLQLTDSQRLERLDYLFDKMKDKQAFTGYFTAWCRKLAINRQESKQDTEQLKKLYGIN
ncbi:hypothetical protein [Mucilaginibacter sp. SP1R1]|uniref:hypothetical protein n=1 Tax=Mucilaginibacter sp. SP1R1 TaxID=2723091 RepID=UPI00161E8581|nr:hypothetical protein [Mucilaginibacter sp. SP1R1]MBB6150707.1 hypothetical protein [Mucilaginibacter sp. SP1R1]